MSRNYAAMHNFQARAASLFQGDIIRPTKCVFGICDTQTFAGRCAYTNHAAEHLVTAAQGGYSLAWRGSAHRQLLYRSFVKHTA
jgi:hypothetical protein